MISKLVLTPVAWILTVAIVLVDRILSTKEQSISAFSETVLH
jgi:hypothetical protein